MSEVDKAIAELEAELERKLRRLTQAECRHLIEALVKSLRTMLLDATRSRPGRP